MPTTATLTPATREKLRLLVLRAAQNDGLITPTDRRLIDRHRAQLAVEDPALLRHLDGQRVCQ